MNSTLFNWSIPQLWRQRTRARRSRFYASQCLWNPAQVESLEHRSVPSITSLFSSGALVVSSDGTDAIVLGVNSSGNTTLNGDPLESAAGTPLAAKSVTALDVLGGPGDNLIDLSDITLAAFATLAQVNVDGGAGNDLIIGSALSDNITSKSGNDTISGGLGNDVINGNVVFINPLASPNAMFTAYTPGLNSPTTTAGSSSGGSSSNGGSSLNSGGLTSNSTPTSTGTSPSSAFRDPVAADSKDFWEDRLSTHFHWQKESLFSRPIVNVSNGVALASTDSRLILLGLSNSALNTPALNRTDSKLPSLSGTAESLDPSQNDNEGLIDLNDNGSVKIGKRLPKAIISIESLDDADGTTFIATRVAMPSRRLQMQRDQSESDVPNIFLKQGEGGFIELLAIATTPAPQDRTNLKRVSPLKRHDQVDAEIGRFIGFERPVVLASRSPIRRITPTHPQETVDVVSTDSTVKISVGVALSASVAVALWYPRARTLRVLRVVFRSMQTHHSKTSNLLTPR